ncbi:putative c2h2 type zinc finger domain protein [Paramyrothecium foliicola]|nr:putative c2h2 type zinc finger domain protein [Paramyrothecium foliicola]
MAGSLRDLNIMNVMSAHSIVASDTSAYYINVANLEITTTPAASNSISLDPWMSSARHGVEAEDGLAITGYQQQIMAQGHSVLGHEVPGLKPFQDFTQFLDGFGLHMDWSPYLVPLTTEEALPNQGIQVGITSEPPISQVNQRPGSPFSSWLPLAPDDMSSSLIQGEKRHDVDNKAPQFKITEEQRLTYVQGFNLHQPFIHQQTWSLAGTPLEMVFGILTMGAQYCFEHRKSEQLFQIGKSILMEKLKNNASECEPKTKAFLSLQDSLDGKPIEAAKDAAEHVDNI